MSNRIKILFAALTALAPATLALAQQQQPQPPRGPQVPAGRAPGQGQPHAVRPADGPAGMTATAAAYERSGGSLLRATLATAPEPPAGVRQGREVSYFAIPEPEPKTIRKHDLITVVVREESTFSSQGTTDTKREADIEAKLEEFVKLKFRNWEAEGGALGPTPPSLKATGRRNFKGEGTVDRSDSLTARMTAEVVDVKPNGTLVLQARKTIKTDDEEQGFVLTGTCRVEDVVADNTVLSTQMYDLRLEKTTKGAVRSATRRGWLTGLVDALSPF